MFITPAVLSAATAAHAQDGGMQSIDSDPVKAAVQGTETKTAKDIPAPWTESEVDRQIFHGDYAIVGVGVASLPSYEGSNSSRLTPAAGAIGRVGGVGFRLKGPSLTTDFLKDPNGAKLGFALGPSLRYVGGRSRKSVKDPVVARLPKLKGTIEAGVSAGLTIKKVLTKHDSFSVGAGSRWVVSPKGGGRIVSASAGYLLPVHKAQVVGFQASAEFVNKTYARYRYSISPTDSLVSGLPAYTGKGGLKETSFGAFTARDLSGDFRDGGLAIGAGFLYSRLYGSAARTPITRIRGSRNQWMFGAGLACSF